MDLKKPKIKVVKKEEKLWSSSDLKSQAAVEPNKDGMKHDNTPKTVKKAKEKSKARNDKKIIVQKSKIEKKSTKELRNLFVFEDISNNKEASSLIHDLINCFTCNSTLPQAELDILQATLYDRIIFVFLYVLNCFIEKIYKKLQGSDYFQKLPQKINVSKKDVCCQTSMTGDIISSVTFKE